MSIGTQSLYEMAKRDVGGGVGGAVFDASFISAVNYATAELADECDLATRPSTISNVGDTITGVSADREYIIYSGVIYYLMRMGQRPTDPKIAMIAYQDSKQRWDDGKGNYQMRVWNDCQAVSTSNMTKLGSTDT